MRLKLLVVGTRAPGWVAAGFEHYARRFPRHNALSLEEVNVRRRAGDAARALATEGERLLTRVGERDHVVALDERGSTWSSRELAERLHDWRSRGNQVVFLVGGPNGLAPACLARADETWSLSALTLPHALVRVVVAEQLYRAHALLSGHPYHRD